MGGAAVSDRFQDENIEAAKHAARARARAARSALDDATCSVAALAVAERLLAMPDVRAAQIVLAYAATPEELDPAAAIDELRALGVTIAFPRVESPGVLGLHAVTAEDELVPGVFGIMEPAPDAPEVSPESVDAVIVPGVAFDEDCWRLGYGGGYYDRLLPLLSADCARIGIAYDEQILPRIPAAEHDVRLDAVVTPTRVVGR